MNSTFLVLSFMACSFLALLMNLRLVFLSFNSQLSCKENQGRKRRHFLALYFHTSVHAYAFIQSVGLLTGM